MKLEQSILSSIHNPFLVKLYYSFHTRKNLYLVRWRHLLLWVVVAAGGWWCDRHGYVQRARTLHPTFGSERSASGTRSPRRLRTPRYAARLFLPSLLASALLPRRGPVVRLCVSNLYAPQAGLDFEKLGRSLATLPLAVRLQLEGDLFVRGTPPFEVPWPGVRLTTIGSPWQGKPVGGEAGESSSSDEESESESEAKEVEPSGSGSRARAEKKEPTPDERPPSTEPGRQQPLLPEAVRQPLAAAQEAKADINEEDLLEELLGMPSEEEAASPATAAPSPSSSGPFFCLFVCLFVFVLFCLWGQQCKKR